MNADADTTLGVILAGGAGSRVDGADKGLLALCGRPLIEHVLDRLRPQCGRTLIVANRNTDHYARYAPVVHDEGRGHAGPLAGMVAAFGFCVANRHALPHWLLTLPVDCPDPPWNLASRLCAALIRQPGAGCAYAVEGGMQQPLFAMYRIGAAPERWHGPARAAMTEHGSPKYWHAKLDAVAVDFDDTGEAFHNLNTPEGFREFERKHVIT